MKTKITVDTDALQWLYSPDWEYHDYGTCKRHLQILFPYRREMKEDEKYPLILFIPGSAWHKQEMYNDIPQYADIAKRGFVVAAMEYRESDIAALFPRKSKMSGMRLNSFLLLQIGSTLIWAGFFLWEIHPAGISP